jgi:hypothetical protein
MINSTYISKSKNGIYHIIVNIEDKWINYQINRIIIEEKIGISLFYDIETQPGNFEEYEELEYIDVPGFYNSDYLITSIQEKDQITLICIPKKLLLNKFFKKIV